MALTPPTFSDLEAFQNEELPPEDMGNIESILQQATDAFWVFTGLDEYPTDERARRIAQYAIMDLTLWLMTQYENRDEINSPFSSERIGSYSYSKMQQAQQNQDSGIYWLDLFFRLLRSTDNSMSWSTSEKVFNPGGLSFEEQERLRKLPVPPEHDPSEPWGFF